MLAPVSSEPPLEWGSLRFFLEAARCKSLAGAARALRVEHTTVGRRIAALERSLGASLVERGPSGLLLTPLGKKVFRIALEMERLAGSIRDMTVKQRSRVRLHVPTGFTMLLGPHLASFRTELPEVALEIVSGGRRAELRAGATDLALRVGRVKDESLVVRRVGEVGSALYGATSYLAEHKRALDLDDLSDHSVIGFHATLSETPAAAWLAARTGRATVVMRSRDASDMVAVARSGAGLAVLPCFLCASAPDLIRLTPEPVASARLSIVYRGDARISPEVRSFVELLVGVLRRGSSELSGRMAISKA